MSKYEEALQRIKDQIEINGRILIDSDTDDENELYDFNLMRKLIEKADKYKWHSHDDLPEEECVRVLCKLLHFGDHEINYSIVKYKNKKWDTGYFYDVLAWRYIEPFNESEE